MEWARIGAVVFAAASLACAWGCGAGDSAAVDDFSTRAAAAICDNFGGCCAEAGFVFDRPSCKLAMRAFVQFDFVDRALAAGATYDARVGDECLDYLTAQAKACDLRDEFTPCRFAFVGGKPTGAACKRNIECARTPDKDVECNFGDVGTDLFCADKPHGKLGSACDSTCTDLIDGSECTGGDRRSPLANCWTTDGLHCGASGQCEPTVALGEACTGVDCSDDAFCDENAICVPNKPDGAACTTNRECDERCQNDVCIRSQSDFIHQVFCSAPPR